MEGTDQAYYSLGDAAKVVRSFFVYLLRRRWWLLLAIIIGLAIGFLYHNRQKPAYEAVTTFILEEKSSSGGLAGLASQVGINLGGMNGGGGIFAGDNILDILKSKTVVRKVLLNAAGDSSRISLAERYLEFSGMRNKWADKQSLAQIQLPVHLEKPSPLQDSVLNLIYDQLIKKGIATERLTETGTIIKVEVKAANDVFARLMSEGLVAEASRLYLDLRTGTAQANIKQMQRRSDSLLVLLNNRSYQAAARQPLDLNPGIKTAIVPVEIASRDKTVLATLYAEVTKNLEASKLLLSQQTPVIQLLDRPGLLLDDNKKSLMILMFGFGVGAAVLFTLVALLFFFLSRFSIQNQPKG